MKKITLLSLVAATVLFTACGEETKKTETNTTTQEVKTATERFKESAADAVNAAKEVAKEAVAVAKVEANKVADAVSEKAAEITDVVKETTAEAVEVAKVEAKEVADAVSEKAAEATESVKETTADTAEASNAIGEEAYAKCKGCHGADGKTKALGKSAVVAGQPAADLEAALAGYKAGSRDVSGMGMLMKGQVSSMSDEEIKAVAAYMSNM